MSDLQLRRQIERAIIDYLMREGVSVSEGHVEFGRYYCTTIAIDRLAEAIADELKSELREQAA